MFKITFDIPESEEKISLKDPILLIGSCFSSEIGEKLLQAKFTTLSNPFGTIYNPHSIFKLLKSESDKNNVIESQGVYYHWDAHGAIYGLSVEDTTQVFEDRIRESQTYLKSTKWLIITLGTAIVYELDSKEIVANCHKVPTKNFKKRFLTQKEIINQFETLHSYLGNLNPELQIIFTVSPVRHIKDGLVENNRSKAILIESVHEILSQNDNVSYFPSYEILIDELRDYRFYKEDMIHPSPQASSYIWDKFCETYFDTETTAFLKEWNGILSALNHRPFQVKSESHQKFLKNTLQKLMRMNEKVDLSVEIARLRKQIV